MVSVWPGARYVTVCVCCVVVRVVETRPCSGLLHERSRIDAEAARTPTGCMRGWHGLIPSRGPYWTATRRLCRCAQSRTVVSVDTCAHFGCSLSR